MFLRSLDAITLQSYKFSPTVKVSHAGNGIPASLSSHRTAPAGGGFPTFFQELESKICLLQAAYISSAYLPSRHDLSQKQVAAEASSYSRCVFSTSEKMSKGNTWRTSASDQAAKLATSDGTSETVWQRWTNEDDRTAHAHYDVHIATPS